MLFKKKWGHHHLPENLPTALLIYFIIKFNLFQNEGFVHLIIIIISQPLHQNICLVYLGDIIMNHI